MRKITSTIVSAFLRGQRKSLGNTRTDGNMLFLHGNAIARRTATGIEISNGGWSSNTTKERLNGLPNVRIIQKNSQWFLNGERWDGNWKLT